MLLGCVGREIKRRSLDFTSIDEYLVVIIAPQIDTNRGIVGIYVSVRLFRSPDPLSPGIDMIVF